MTDAGLACAAIIGGAVGVRGGVEQFAGRLLQCWPPDAPVVAFSAFTNTAYRRHRDGSLAGVRLFWRTFAATVRKLRRLTRVDGRRVTLVVHYGNALDISYLPIARLVGVHKTIVIAHCSPNWAHLRSPTLSRLAAWVLKSASAVITLSNQQFQFFRGLGLRNVHAGPTLLGEALNDYPRLPFAKRLERTLVFSGRVSREKGALDAIQLILELSQQSRETWSLEYFGEIDRGIEEEFADAVGIARARGVHIGLHGHIESNLLFTQLGRSRYLVYLSAQDAFPLSVLEAVAAGALPIVYDLPGTVEITARWGGIVGTPGAIQEIAQQVLAIERARKAFEVDLEMLKSVYGDAAFQSKLQMLLAQSS